jgi:hypothetical protein
LNKNFDISFIACVRIKTIRFAIFEKLKYFIHMKRLGKANGEPLIIVIIAPARNRLRPS